MVACRGQGHSRVSRGSVHCSNRHSMGLGMGVELQLAGDMAHHCTVGLGGDLGVVAHLSNYIMTLFH